MILSKTNKKVVFVFNENFGSSNMTEMIRNAVWNAYNSDSDLDESISDLISYKVAEFEDSTRLIIEFI